MGVFAVCSAGAFGIFLVQLLLCFRAKRKLWRFLPLLISGGLAVLAELMLIIFRAWSINIAAVLLLTVLLGGYLLGGVILGWLVYAIIRGVLKIFHR